MSRFSKRHREFLTSDGTFEQKMPPHLETRINTFRSVLAQLHREKQFPAFQVGAMDELSLHWGQAVERRNGVKAEGGIGEVQRRREA